MIEKLDGTVRRTSVAEDWAADQAREKWKTDQGLRNEFHQNLEACVAYFRAEARGAVRVTGKSTSMTDVLARGAARQQPGSSMQTDRSAARTRRAPVSTADAEREYDDALDRFERDPAVRAEFTSAEAYAAYMKALARGKVRIYSGGQGLLRARRGADQAPPARSDSHDEAAAPAQHLDENWQRARWDSTPSLRSSFQNFDVFMRFARGEISIDQARAVRAGGGRG